MLEWSEALSCLMSNTTQMPENKCNAFRSHLDHCSTLLLNRRTVAERCFKSCETCSHRALWNTFILIDSCGLDLGHGQVQFCADGIMFFSVTENKSKNAKNSRRLFIPSTFYHHPFKTVAEPCNKETGLSAQLVCADQNALSELVLFTHVCPISFQIIPIHMLVHMSFKCCYNNDLLWQIWYTNG